jgi:hypothetical protein
MAEGKASPQIYSLAKWLIDHGPEVTNRARNLDAYKARLKRHRDSLQSLWTDVAVAKSGRRPL